MTNPRSNPRSRAVVLAISAAAEPDAVEGAAMQVPLDTRVESCEPAGPRFRNSSWPGRCRAVHGKLTPPSRSPAFGGPS